MSDTSQEPSKNSPDNALDSPLIKSAMLEDSFEYPDLAASVLARFAEDLNHPLPCQYDFEFISAYFDNQLHSEPGDQNLLRQRVQTFEQHLPHCSSCNQRLGLVLEITELYRNYLYRLESRLETLDFSAQVIARLAMSSDPLDESVSLQAVGCAAYESETFSSYLDRELPEATVQEMDAHLRSCSPCREASAQFFELNRNIQGFYSRLSAQDEETLSLNLWPGIRQKIEQESAFGKKPSSAIRFRKKQRWFSAGTAAVAAAFLALFVSFRLFSPEAPLSTEKSVNIAALEEAIQADRNEALAAPRMQVPGSVFTAAYPSPEAYLFSLDSDFMPEESLSRELDVSAFVLNEYP